MPTGTRNGRSGDQTEQAPKRAAKEKAEIPKPAAVAPKKRKRRTNKAKLVDKAIACFEKKLESEDVKATVGDFIRLLQLQKELEGEDTQEIRITWVDSDGTESA